jgi:hypothetical protein
MPASKFDHLLHPLVFYERVELAPEQNALESWRDASRAIADEDELGNLAYPFDPDCGCGEAACMSCQPPQQSELLSRLVEVLAKNATARMHFERGWELGRLQVRLTPPTDFDGGLDIQGMRQLARLNLCEGHLARLQGEPLRAAAWYAKNAKFGRILGDCDGSIVIFLVARAIQGTGMYALLRLAESGPVPPELRLILHAARALEIGVESAAQVQRSELSQFNWPILVSLAETPHDCVFARAMELFFPDSSVQELDPTDPFPEMTRGMARIAEFTRRARLLLFEGHPDLWDAEETLRVFSLTTARQIAELLDDHLSRQEIEAELSSWQPRAEAYRELQPREFSPLGSFLAYDETWRPPSDRKLRRIRNRLRSHRNPLGIMAVDLLTGVGGQTLLTSHEPRQSSGRGALDLNGSPPPAVRSPSHAATSKS